MGKQICFYITPKDVNSLIEQIYLQNGFVLDSTGAALSKDELVSIAHYDYCEKHFDSNKFFVAKSDFSLYYHCNTVKRRIDEQRSEVIEFSLCTPSPAKVIDTSSVENNFRKDGFIIIDNQNEYYRQMNELMKNPIYTDNPNFVEHGFEHGRFWYSPEYFDDNGKKVSKSKELSKLFNSLSKFIREHFKQTKDKFAYIGTDAYEKYRDGDFIPCSGRNKIVVE